MRKLLSTLIIFSIVLPTFSFHLSQVTVEEYNFGKTDQGGSQWILYSWSQKVGCRFEAPEDGAISNVACYCRARASDMQFRALIYSDNSGVPDALLAYGDWDSLSQTEGWQNISISLNITRGTFYWIGIQYSGRGGCNFWYDLGAIDQTAYNRGSPTTLDDPFGAPTYRDYELSIYASYTPAGPPPPRIIYVDASNAGDPLEDGSLEHPFDTIQEGIFNTTSSGETVYVKNGTYDESLITWMPDVFISNIVIRGQSRLNTVINGSLSTGEFSYDITVMDFEILGTVKFNSYYPGQVALRLNLYNCSVRSGVEICGYYCEVKSNAVQGGLTLISPYHGGSGGNTIENNVFLGTHDREGIYLSAGSSVNIIRNNTIINATTGIFENGEVDPYGYYFSEHNKIEGNRLVNCGIGVDLTKWDMVGPSYANISGNTFIDNNIAIVLDRSTNNTIFHNDLINNTVQVSLFQSVDNVWDDGYPSGGNYWSDYDGTDLYHGPYQNISGSDSIGDTPYTIDANNTDHYPLMGVGSPPSAPTVLSPNGGELWSDTQSITWSASTDPDGDPVTYEIEYSVNGGASWQPLTTAVSDTSYVWDTTLFPDSNDYLVRVRAYDGLQVSEWDESDDAFLVDNIAPLVEIVYPSEGQVVTGHTVWVNGTITELNKGTSQPSIDDASFSLVEWTGTYFAFKNTTVVAEGLISVTVSFTDLVGNNGSDTVSFSYSTAVSETELSVSVTPSSALVGYEVEIIGRLNWQENGTGIADAPILVSYQYHPDLMSCIPAEQSWNIISTVTTATDGSYSATWFVMSSGIYRIEAFYPGSDQAYSATSTASLLIADLEGKIFSVSSNSTVSNMNFNSTTKEIKFTVSGTSGTAGYLDMFLAKSLVPDVSELKIYFDSVEKSFDAILVDDTWFIRLTYTHSSHTVRISSSHSLPPIISREPMILTIGIMIIGSIIALLLLRKKRRARAVPPNLQGQQITL